MYTMDGINPGTEAGVCFFRPLISTMLFRCIPVSFRPMSFIKPPKTLLRQVGKALTDFNMIREGDRVLLGLSGGKDSLSLLHILHHFQRHAPIHFEFAAMTVDPMAGDFDPSPMIPYLKSLGVEYHYRKEPIMDMEIGRASCRERV